MISPAELPLNARGAVYHLDLRPEELADVVITVGDPARVPQVSQYFDYIELKRAHREFITHTGYLGKQRISVISTGIGVPNIDIVMNELDALVNIDLTTRALHDKHKPLTIIRLGTTGSLQAMSQPGDIVVSRYAIGFDTLLDYYEGITSPTTDAMHAALQNYLAQDSSSFYVTEANNTLVQAFSPLGTVGITATCGGFYGPQGRRLRLPLRYPRFLDKLPHFTFSDMAVVNLEMETAALLGLGQLLEHRCLSLSVVLANRMTGDFVADIDYSVQKLISSAMEHF